MKSIPPSLANCIGHRESAKFEKTLIYLRQDNNEEHKNKYVTEGHNVKLRLRTPFRDPFVPALARTKATMGKITKKCNVSIWCKL